MQATGDLIDNKIIIKNSKDVGRFYNKSHLGKTIAGDKLELELLEAVFLIGEEKLRVFQNKKEIDFKNLLKIAAEKISNFEVKYLIFRDLRKRGIALKKCDKKNCFDFYINKKNDEEKNCFISVFYERNNIDISEIQSLIQSAIKQNSNLWFAVVDEEGDITYYDVCSHELNGDIKNHKFSKTDGMLLENSVVVFDKKNSKALFDKEFFGKPFGEGIQLSMVEALFLMEKKVIEIKNAKTDSKLSSSDFIKLIKKSQPDIDRILIVFKDLKNRGLIVKTGFKFGTHFRAYTKKPDLSHAEYLIHVVNKSYKVLWAEISRAVRLAHSVNKEIILAKVENKKIDYIKFGRLRP